MQSKVAQQLVDLFRASTDNTTSSDPSRQTEGETAATSFLPVVSAASKTDTQNPSSSDIEDDDDEVHLRIYPIVDPAFDWILRVNENNSPVLSYVVSKQWSWEQIKHCIGYELWHSASCTTRQSGKVTDYYYRPTPATSPSCFQRVVPTLSSQGNVNSTNNNNNANVTGDTTQQPRPICNLTDFLKAIRRQPPLQPSESTTTKDNNKNYNASTKKSTLSHYVLDLFVTCNPLQPPPSPAISVSPTDLLPTTTATTTSSTTPSFDHDTTTSIHTSSLTDIIGMAEALMTLKSSSATTTATQLDDDGMTLQSQEVSPSGRDDGEDELGQDEQEQEEPWNREHNEDHDVHIRESKGFCELSYHDRGMSTDNTHDDDDDDDDDTTGRSGIEIWNSGPQTVQEAHKDSSPDINGSNGFTESRQRTMDPPPPRPPPQDFPMQVHSYHHAEYEQTPAFNTTRADDTEGQDSADDEGPYDDGVEYPYSDSSAEDSYEEEVQVNPGSKKRPRSKSKIDSSNRHAKRSCVPYEKEPGRPNSPTEQATRVETTLVYTKTGIFLPVLGPYDVLCSRSKVAFKAIGNRRLRILMELHAPRYASTLRKVDKTAIVASLVTIIQGAGGNFIRRDRTTGEWVIAPNEIAKEKVGHGLRDAVGNRNRTIYDILGQNSCSRIQLKRKAAQIVVEKIAKRASIYCKQTPKPAVIVPKPPPPEPPRRASIVTPPYTSKHIPVRFGDFCHSSQKNSRSSVGPLKKRFLAATLAARNASSSTKKSVTPNGSGGLLLESSDSEIASPAVHPPTQQNQAAMTMLCSDEPVTNANLPAADSALVVVAAVDPMADTPSNAATRHVVTAEPTSSGSIPSLLSSSMLCCPLV